MNIWVVRADIAEVRVDAIVTAANPWLRPGGGVDGAVHRAAGPALAEACERITGGCSVGSAVITPGFSLARWVIHAVGPDCRIVEDPQEQDRLLRGAYMSCLQLALKNGVRSIALPGISTGLYQFPIGRACRIAVESINEFNGDLPEQVYFVAFTQEMEMEYYKALQER